MTEFMGKDFLLDTETARHLYHTYSEHLPIIDYHCHIPQREIYENRKFENIAQVWLGGTSYNPDGSKTVFGDHYKWRLMRCNGVPEEYITGDKPDFERFEKFAETLEKCIGNPMYHWCHLELKKYFGYEGILSKRTAKEVWDLCNDKLQNDPNLTVQGIVRSSNVRFVGTTDDPVDDLAWHKKLKDENTVDGVTVAPSYRPDKALNIHKEGFAEYIGQLAKVCGMELNTAADVRNALENRLNYFVERGCKVTDHGLDSIPFTTVDEAPATAAFAKAMRGEAVTDRERDDYQTYMLYELGRMYAEKDVVMQIHYGAIRNTNEKMFRDLGADTGFDMIGSPDCSVTIGKLLSALTKEGKCPKVILYSLNPIDLDMLATMCGCFQDSSARSKIQLGSAWWFGDTKDGMEKQLKTLARLGVLGNFVGMLTDSRSFLSYTRHDYFRRILCSVIGKWVENGEYPYDEESLKQIVEGISYYNAEKYFGL